MFSSANKPPIDRRQSLAGVPVLNPGVTLEPRDGGRATLIVPIKRGNGFFARFTPKVMRRRFNLDEIGTFVLGQVDGRRTALQIIEVFLHTYKLNRREAELSVVEFLRILMRRGAISILID